MKVKKKSSFTPNKGRECNLDAYLEQVTMDTLKLLRVSSDTNCDNLTMKEREALEGLRKDESIIIKPADKGGALVIMDKVDYEEAVLKMLKDDTFYTEKADDINSSFEKEVEMKINELRSEGYVSFKEADYLLEQKPETPRFYSLPKIHKGFDPFPPLRPIVSGCNYCFERK